MKALDTIAEILLIIGGLNWGLVGVVNFNLIESVFGPMMPLTRIIYGLVGIAALYHIFEWKAMKKRGR